MAARQNGPVKQINLVMDAFLCGAHTTLQAALKCRLPLRSVSAYAHDLAEKGLLIDKYAIGSGRRGRPYHRYVPAAHVVQFEAKELN